MQRACKKYTESSPIEHAKSLQEVHRELDSCTQRARSEPGPHSAPATHTVRKNHGVWYGKSLVDELPGLAVPIPYPHGVCYRQPYLPPYILNGLCVS